MPGLRALGQHTALTHQYAQLQPVDGLYAFLDDVYLTSGPERILEVLRAAQACLPRHAKSTSARPGPGTPRGRSLPA